MSGPASGAVVIAPGAGGLGDQLVYSTLPQCFAEQGREVYVSAATPFRNPEIAEMVWGRNPYVRGFSDAPANASPPDVTRLFMTETKRRESPIAAMEAVHGFERGRRYPFVGYVPVPRPDFGAKIVADPRSISQTFSPAAFADFVAWVARWFSFDPRDVIVVQGRYTGNVGAKSLPKNERYHCATIFEYADVIASAGMFLVTESGGHSLACALRGDRPSPQIFSLFSTEAFNDRLVTFPNAHYCVTGRSGPDFSRSFPWDSAHPPRRRRRWPWP